VARFGETSPIVDVRLSTVMFQISASTLRAGTFSLEAVSQRVIVSDAITHYAAAT
jgi:hypothetical protein